MMESTAGLYIHIPFCRAKCHYCDFYSVADREDSLGRLVDAIIKEMAQRGAEQGRWVVDTIFIGGGTPSLMEPRQLEALLAAASDTFDLSAVEEFTLEANPGEIPADKLAAFKSLGVNRLSFGFQSFQPDILKFLGRLHTAEDNTTAFEAARKAGIENINADLIYNIPGQSRAQLKSDLTRLAAMEPEHISAYSLTVEGGTGLEQMVNSGEVVMPSEDEDRGMLLMTRKQLAESGYAAYEISNHARDGMECRHNLHYWRIEPYLAFGPSAHRFDGASRSWNVRHLDGYMERIEAGNSPEAGRETLSAEQLYHERLIFGLRLAAGIDIRSGLGFTGTAAFRQCYQPLIEKWAGYLEITGGSIKLAGEGVLLADAIAADFMTVLPAHIVNEGTEARGAA